MAALRKKNPAKFQTNLLKHIKKLTQSNATLAAIHGRLLLFAMLELDSFDLRKWKKSLQRAQLKQHLSSIIAGELKAKVIEHQLLGGFLLARSCVSYRSVLPKKTCQQLGQTVPKSVHFTLKKYRHQHWFGSTWKTLQQIKNPPLKTLPPTP